MRLTSEQAIENHRKMWLWIAIETLRNKRCVFKQEYFEKHNIKNIIDNDCYCCEYDILMLGKCCENCPIDWGADETVEYCYCCDKRIDIHTGETEIDGLFSRWNRESDYKESALLAYKISKLPERK